VLVTGPTGSGKSTTLYAALNEVNSARRTSFTIEDPVEYEIDGITQIQVNPKAGLLFETGLRAIVRADPDIIMVGEIRDRETAKIAVEAALTGHLVLSTLHTNDAATTITRLIEMGVEPFLVASSIDCVVAQRLVRTLCQQCKRRVILPMTTLREYGYQASFDVEAYEPVGCKLCGGSGYRGRTRNLRGDERQPGDPQPDARASFGVRRARARGLTGHAAPARRRAREGQAGTHLGERGCPGREQRHPDRRLAPARNHARGRFSSWRLLPIRHLNIDGD